MKQNLTILPQRSKSVLNSLVLLPLVFALVAALSSPACARSREKESDKTKTEEKSPVFAKLVKTGNISEKIRTSGDVLPMYGIDINPETQGKVVDIFVEVGSVVKKGQKLAQIDDEVQRAQYQQALAAIVVAKAAIETQKVNIESSKSSLVSAKADVEAAESSLKNLRVTKERNEKLLAEGAVSRQNVDDIITQYDAALARHTSAQTAVKRANDAINSAYTILTMRKAELVQAEANLNTVRVAVENCVVEAPFDGVITARNADPGAMASPMNALFKMEQNDPVKVIGSINEKDIERVKEGETKVLISSDSLSETYEGTLFRLYPSLDSSSRTCKIEIRLENSKKRLRTGMFANIVVLVKTHKNAVIVPRSSLLKYEGTYFTYVVENDRTVRRNIETGIIDDDLVEVLSGLKAGDIIVSQGLEFVRANSLVSYSLED